MIKQGSRHMDITEKLRNPAPNEYGNNAEFAQGMADTATEIEHLRDELAEMRVIRGIDDRFGGRLALMLECVLLNPTGYYDEACSLLDEYKSEWEKVNPTPPTFMGEPLPQGQKAQLLDIKSGKALEEAWRRDPDQ